MSKDIRLAVSFWDHWKTIVLRSELGYPAIESLQRIWCFAAVNKPDGVLSGMSIRTIEIAAHWSGEPGALVGKLVELRFLDAIDGFFVLHDWEDHNGWVVHSQDRSERGKKGAAARWAKKNNDLPPNGGNDAALRHATSIAPSNAGSNTFCNAPTPTPKDTSTVVDVCPLVPSEPAPTAARVVLKSVKPPCPYEAIRDLYHEILPELRACRSLSETRKGYLRQRWQDSPGPDLEKWRKFFGYVRGSDFLMGRKGGSGDRPPFEADLEWLTRPCNFVKVIEGKYHAEVRHG